MNVAELKNTILKKGWHFRFKSPNPLKKDAFGWKNLEQVDKEYGGFEAYLKKIAESQKLRELNIEAKAKNGSGWLNKGLFLVVIEPIGNIGSIEKEEKEEPIIPIKNTEHIKNHEDTNSTNSTTPMEDLKTHIENSAMKTELRFLQADNDRLKESNKKLDQKNEELFNEVSKLSRELATNNAKLDLDYRKKELELMAGQKAGLSGIVEEVKNLDPKTIALFGSFLQPNNKNFQKFLEGGDNENGGGEASLNGPKHENSDVQDFIENSIYPMLTGAKAAEVGMIGGLIEYFLKYPDHLVAAYKKFLPGAINDLKGDEGKKDDDDLDEDDK